ncbi:hypothetical protein GCM10007907_18280 [Chitinimonas prasina]|uniref:Uncharacterized protein n=1 Tax=Chitinimonas prasina TaxID=1434937 RepID=A0ABQ5YGB1_9NEIS|nr:hypothetical protein GCM10007907_18280 [Chitinimonas prasina]
MQHFVRSTNLSTFTMRITASQRWLVSAGAGADELGMNFILPNSIETDPSVSLKLLLVGHI